MKKNSIGKTIKKKIKKALHLLGLDIVKYNLYNSNDVLLKTILNHFQVKTIFDVGANIGQYAEGVFNHGYKGKIYSFEPIKSVFDKLVESSYRKPNWEVYNLGVGSKEEDAIINISENFVSSSILKVGDASLSAEPMTRTTHQEKISITTIDSFFSKEGLPEVEILLKLDVQGYELEALRGALKSLPSIKLLQIELSFANVYENGPLFEEILQFLKEQKFEILTIIPEFRNEKSGRMLQADGIFVRVD